MILHRHPALTAARAQIHADALAGGVLRLYDGPMPAAGDSPTGNLLAEIPLPDPAGTVDAGAFALATPLQAMAAADGAPTWARITDASGAWALDLDAGATGSGAALTVSPAQIYAGGQIQITRLRLIEP